MFLDVPYGAVLPPSQMVFFGGYVYRALLKRGDSVLSINLLNQLHIVASTNNRL